MMIGYPLEGMNDPQKSEDLDPNALTLEAQQVDSKKKLKATHL